MTKALRGVLLDIDGTLLDSNDAHAHAWVDALAEFGISADLGRVRRLIGKGSEKLLPEVSGIEKDSDRGRVIIARSKEIFAAHYLPGCLPFLGARALVQRMRDDRLVLVVATSASKEELDALLAHAGVRDLIDDATTSSDSERSKPDPDIVSVAAKRAGHSPHQLVMIGDTPYDVEAASKAGVAAIALRCGGWTDADLSGALAVYDDPADLLEHYDESPLGVG